MKRVLRHLLALLLIVLTLPAQAEFSFPDAFLTEGEPALCTETSYRSQNLSIDITARRYDDSDVYVADIYVRDIASLQRGFAFGAWRSGTMEPVDIAKANNAVLAITGDYAHLFTSGWLMGNGQLLRRVRNNERDACLIYRNGEMRTIRAQDMDDAWMAEEADDLWQIFCFGPELLDAEGKACTEFNTEVRSANPRSAIGYYEPGHYCFVQVDGRGTHSAVTEGEYNIGLTLDQLSVFMETLGCQTAYNLDGGQSAMLWFDGRIISTPYMGGRPLGDIVLIREPSSAAMP